jgi:replicative DNA helicase
VGNINAPIFGGDWVMNKDSVVSQGVQDAFVFLAITDTKFLSIARRAVKPRHFSSQVTEDIIEICYSYFDQFNVAPEDHFHDELVRFLFSKTNEDKNLYVEYLTKIQEMTPPNRAYIISRINKFVKAREFEEAAVKFVGLTQAGEFEKAKNLMQDALRVGIEEEDIGLVYFDSPPTYFDMEEDKNDFISTIGVDQIDERLRRGLRRTDFLLILGGYKAGKSWACHHVAKEGLMRGRKVLHISHENSAKDVEMRYDMTFGSMKSFDDDPYTEIEEIDDEGHTIKRERVRVGSVFDDEQRVVQIRKRVAKFGGELIIKKYPMRSCTIDEIRRYIDYLETYNGFIPDIVINDYVEKMNLPNTRERREGIDEVYQISKGIADERKLLMVTVSQTTRGALEKKILGQKDFAEDIRKFGDVDLVLAISRTKAQARINRMQMYVLGNRHGPMDFGVTMVTNFDIGQLCMSSWPIKYDKPMDDEVDDYKDD